MHGYVLFYDDSGHVLLQKKAYFQHYSFQRSCFYTQPVCANPGQYTLPGGSMDDVLLQRSGHMHAALKQFQEESGVAPADLKSWHCNSRGYYSGPEQDTPWNKEFFYVHFLHVESVGIICSAANAILREVRSSVGGDCLSESAKTIVKEIFERTGFNDDAAAEYKIVPFTDLLSYLSTQVGFDKACEQRWTAMVRQQRLFAPERRESKIRSIIRFPGEGRDWLVGASRCFLLTPDAAKIVSGERIPVLRGPRTSNF